MTGSEDSESILLIVSSVSCSLEVCSVIFEIAKSEVTWFCSLTLGVGCSTFGPDSMTDTEETAPESNSSEESLSDILRDEKLLFCEETGYVQSKKKKMKRV